MNDDIIHYNYVIETVNNSDTLYFFLETFPTVKFRYTNLKLGEPDKDNMITASFNLEYANPKDIEQMSLDDNFYDQTTGLLVHLVEGANNKIKGIISSSNPKA